MTISSVTRYAVKITSGNINFTPYLDGLEVLGSRESPFTKINVMMHMTKNQYEKEIIPNKDRLEISIISSKGCDANGKSIPDVDASFSYTFSIISEQRTLNTSVISDDGCSGLDQYIFVCVPTVNARLMGNTLVDCVYFNKSRKDILNDILSKSGCDYEVQSDIYNEGEIIEQCFIPPCKIINAIRHVNNYFTLFKTGSPIYINYTLNKKLCIGSCLKNNLTPLSIYLGGDRESWKEANATRAYNSPEYRYSILQADVSTDYNVTLLSLGSSQSYTFSPINRLYNRNIVKLEDYDIPELPFNQYGSKSSSFESTKRINIKESWKRRCNGMPIVNESEDNKNFYDSYIASCLSGSNMLNGELVGIVRFEDIFGIGRKVKLATAKNTAQFEGEYYLHSFSFKMSPVNNKEYWTANTFVSLRSGIDTKSLA